MDEVASSNDTAKPKMASTHDDAADPASPARPNPSRTSRRRASHSQAPSSQPAPTPTPQTTRRRRSSTTDDVQRAPVRAFVRRRSYSQQASLGSTTHRRQSSARREAGVPRIAARRNSDAPRTPARQAASDKAALEPKVTAKRVTPRANMDFPGTPRVNENDRMLEARRTGVSRKRSLVKPERRQLNREDADYHYRKHAQNMPVMPSTTGRDPQLEDGPSDFTSSKYSPSDEKHRESRHRERRRSEPRTPKRLSRAASQREREMREKAIRDAKIQEAVGAPTLWGTYCHLVTVWCPDTVLRWFGFKERERRRAWREKMGLLSVMAFVMGFVGFLTFGFTETVCSNGGGTRLRINHVSDEYMIFHGMAYDLSQSHHPAAIGIPAGANVLYSLPQKHAGQDGSFLFQNVNGACKGLITLAPGSDVPTDSDGNLAWYFPCHTYNQDGSSQPDLSIPYYLGWACHTGKSGREEFYGLSSSGHVYFTWDDVRNSSRNLIVYSGSVLDLNLLSWFNRSQVTVPDRFAELESDPFINGAIRGRDVTLAFSNGDNKQIAQCLSEIIKVGSIDTDTVGCFASRVVLYLSLVFILGIVSIRFMAALLFQWFLCRKYAAPKTSMSGDAKRRKQQIEEWTDNIYRPPPKMTDPAIERDQSNKRNSFLPTTSRFTSPYAIERALNRSRAPLTTMSSQYASRYLQSSGSGSYGNCNKSEVTLQTYGDTGTIHGTSEGQSSFTDPKYASTQRYMGGHSASSRPNGPQSLVHEAVVPQPPPDWQPFGFPLAHTICLVTAYSEGHEGIRTTLDSIAMTDYPNSHKLIFVVCDGMVKGKGETKTTPDICVGMLKDHVIPPKQVKPFSYVAVASGAKRHNMAKAYAGFYDYGRDSIIPQSRQQRVPMIVLVKCGNPGEGNGNSIKPGNRGKRDSQVILMSFLQKVMFDERMTELEYEIFNGIWKLTGISPDFYEMVLMVDADTKIFPDSMSHMVSAMVHDSEIMGLCGETKIANKAQSWVTMIQVFEYFISHHSLKSFESCFGGVTCLPGCFCMYRIKTPKGGQNYWVPILANPDIVEHYSENVVDTLHKKNLYLLGEDRYLSTLMLKTFPKRKQVFVPQAVCKTTVPETFKILLSQRRRWINSTIHNLMELVLVRDLCGTFCFSMQFVVFIDLIGTVVLPAAICFTLYVGVLGIKAAAMNTPAPIIPLVLLALILGLPGVLIVVTAHRPIYVMWMLVYLISLPIWNLVLPAYAYWHFDDFSWGDTRQTAGEKKGSEKRGGHDGDGEFDSSQITMKRWADFEQERRAREVTSGSSGANQTNDIVSKGAAAAHGRRGSASADSQMVTVPLGSAHVSSSGNTRHERRRSRPATRDSNLDRE